jgi:DNA-binding YbaB/EbfC family protein
MNQMQQMLMQAQKMQRELQKAEAALAEKEFKVPKNGMVDVVVLGSLEVKEINIDKDAVDPDNAEMLAEAIRMAINEANQKIAEEKAAIEERITGRTGPFGI